MTPADLEALTAELRRRHIRLQSYGTTRGHWWPTKAAEWVADAWQYDQVLVAVAQLLSVEVPPPPPEDALRRLSPPERADLERGLRRAGIDVAEPESSEDSGVEGSPGPRS